MGNFPLAADLLEVVDVPPLSVPDRVRRQPGRVEPCVEVIVASNSRGARNLRPDVRDRDQ